MVFQFHGPSTLPQEELADGTYERIFILEYPYFCSCLSNEYVLFSGLHADLYYSQNVDSPTIQLFKQTIMFRKANNSQQPPQRKAPLKRQPLNNIKHSNRLNSIPDQPAPPRPAEPLNKTSYSIMSDYQVSVYDAINNSIHEYFIKKEFPRTLEVFQQETKHKLFGPAHPSQPMLRSHKLDQQLISNFERGEHAEYFSNWNQFIPLNVRYFDENAVKLEFYLQVYFLIYDIHPAFSAQKGLRNKVRFNKAKLEHFRLYLENKGSQLSKDNEFLPFFAIPYIQNPLGHPIMLPFLKQEWPMILKDKLNEFLSTLYNNGDVPILLEMYQSYMQKLQQQQGIFEQSGNHVSPSISEIKTPVEKSSLFNVQQHNQDLVNAIQELNQKYIDLQKNYKQFAENAKQNLIESQNKWACLAKELVFLSKELMGKAVSGPKLEEIKDKVTKYELFLNSNFDDLIAQSQDLSVFDRNSLQDGFSEINGTPINKSQIVSLHKSKAEKSVTSQAALKTPLQQFEPLDYVKIISGFLNIPSEKEEQIKLAVLLNHLRCRIVKQHSNAHRRQVIQEYQQYDILGCYDKNQVIILDNLLFGQSEMLRLQTIMLINTLCSDSLGREYIINNLSIINYLLDIGKKQTTDNKVLKNSLAALQKLSLRKRAQRAMLNGQILHWLFKILKSINDTPGQHSSPYYPKVSEFTMEYSSAMLMNLSLRQLGKEQCNSIKEELIPVLISLLYHDNPQIRTFINGTLYSLFSFSPIRHYAKNHTDIADKLQAILLTSEERFQRQIQYILEQLTSEEGDPDLDDSDDLDDYDDQDEDEPFQEDDELDNYQEAAPDLEDNIRQELQTYNQVPQAMFLQYYQTQHNNQSAVGPVNQFKPQISQPDQQSPLKEDPPEEENEFISEAQVPYELQSKPKLARTPVEPFRPALQKSQPLLNLPQNSTPQINPPQNSKVSLDPPTQLHHAESHPHLDTKKIELRVFLSYVPIERGSHQCRIQRRIPEQAQVAPHPSHSAEVIMIQYSAMIKKGNPDKDYSFDLIERSAVKASFLPYLQERDNLGKLLSPQREPSSPPWLDESNIHDHSEHTLSLLEHSQTEGQLKNFIFNRLIQNKQSCRKDVPPQPYVSKQPRAKKPVMINNKQQRDKIIATFQQNVEQYKDRHIEVHSQHPLPERPSRLQRLPRPSLSTTSMEPIISKGRSENCLSLPKIQQQALPEIPNTTRAHRSLKEYGEVPEKKMSRASMNLRVNKNMFEKYLKEEKEGFQKQEGLSYIIGERNKIDTLPKIIKEDIKRIRSIADQARMVKYNLGIKQMELEQQGQGKLS